VIREWIKNAWSRPQSSYHHPHDGPHERLPDPSMSSIEIGHLFVTSIDNSDKEDLYTLGFDTKIIMYSAPIMPRINVIIQGQGLSLSTSALPDSGAPATIILPHNSSNMPISWCWTNYQSCVLPTDTNYRFICITTAIEVINPDHACVNLAWYKGVNYWKERARQTPHIISKLSSCNRIIAYHHHLGSEPRPDAIAKILSAWFSEAGIPITIETDGGPQICSKFADFCERWSIIHEMSSVAHHQSNGLTESCVKVVKHRRVQIGMTLNIIYRAKTLQLPLTAKERRQSCFSVVSFVQSYPAYESCPLQC